LNGKQLGSQRWQQQESKRQTRPTTDGGKQKSFGERHHGKMAGSITFDTSACLPPSWGATDSSRSERYLAVAVQELINSLLALLDTRGLPSVAAQRYFRSGTVNARGYRPLEFQCHQGSLCSRLISTSIVQLDLSGQ